ncbi:hypothetical protein RND71_016341 [Anisodus tanguticus]|uniref:Uncharacterized protein n=1 Tax=Anisodus tanguticus TaxID=243964 RepID=A0AAE1S942_9SOLA|nr:hypothetical protein RND71_016341 [Anisodus tanguticus]
MPPPTGVYQNQQFNREAPPLPLTPQYYRNQQPNRPNFYENQQFNRPNCYQIQQFNRPNFYENQQFNRPNLYENQQFNRPNFHENQQFNRPKFYENQQFRPRPLPPMALNFRNWEYARPGPPPHCDGVEKSSTDANQYETSILTKGKLLQNSIMLSNLNVVMLKEVAILGMAYDVSSFQEVDRFQELEAKLKLRGYSGIWKEVMGSSRGNSLLQICKSILVSGKANLDVPGTKRSRISKRTIPKINNPSWTLSFKLVQEEFIEFKKFGLRDNVAQICVFESSKSSPAPSAR